MSPAALIPVTKHGQDVVPWERRCPIEAIEDVEADERIQLYYEIELYAYENGFSYWTTHFDQESREIVLRMFRDPTESPR